MVFRHENPFKIVQLIRITQRKLLFKDFEFKNQRRINKTKSIKLGKFNGLQKVHKILIEKLYYDLTLKQFIFEKQIF